jgi:hypothetical protein
MLTPAQAAEKHSRNLKNASVDIENGIRGVQVSPTALAAKKKDKMIANLTESVRSGKWEKGLLSVSLEDWRKQAIEVGLPRIAAGIDAAQPYMIKFYSEFLPYVEKVSNEVNSMKDLTFQDSMARMIKNATLMKDFKRS